MIQIVNASAPLKYYATYANNHPFSIPFNLIGRNVRGQKENLIFVREHNNLEPDENWQGEEKTD